MQREKRTVKELVEDWCKCRIEMRTNAFNNNNDDLDYARQLIKDQREIEDKLMEWYNG